MGFGTYDNNKDPNDYAGFKILSAVFENDTVHLKLLDLDKGKQIKIRLYDSAQYCCESRYMTTDDNVASMNGAILYSINTVSGGSEDSEWGTHQIQFMN